MVMEWSKITRKLSENVRKCQDLVRKCQEIILVVRKWSRNVRKWSGNYPGPKQVAIERHLDSVTVSLFVHVKK